MHINTLKDVRDTLVLADRSGAEKDEPEGMRYIMISDTIANQMIAAIEGELTCPMEAP